MRSSRRDRKGKSNDQNRAWDDWQRYVKKETQRLKQKSGGQVVELDFKEPSQRAQESPDTPPEQNEAVEQQVGEVFEARQAPVPGVPREEAIQVSDDQIGRTVKPYTYEDYRNIKPLTSPDLFESGEGLDADKQPAEADPEVLEELREIMDESVSTVEVLEPEVTEPATDDKEPGRGKGKKKGRKKKSKEPSAEEEPGLFESVSEHQVVSRQRLTKKTRIDREELIEKLLDPVISLEEASTLIGVCKTTVRRYTNKGELECLRTPGQQRRFKLSQVLEFVKKREAQQKARGAGKEKQS